MSPMTGRREANGVAARDLRDVRSLDPDAHVVLTLRDLVPAVLNTKLRVQTKDLFSALARKLEPIAGQAFLVLERIPETDEGRIDLRFVQGSGFYTRSDGLWLYHKGAGSVEALAEGRLQGRCDLRYPSFGAEMEGERGIFSWGSILGIKLLSATAREFLHTTILMLRFIEENRLSSCEDVSSRVSIPLAITVLPDLTNRVRAGMLGRPEGIRQEVGRKMEAGDSVSKLLLVTPSPTRGTDHRDVDGKWTETRNVFLRSLTLDPSAVLQKLKRNPYLQPSTAFDRGHTIGFMARNGFLYDPSSSHLQNFYVIRHSRARNVFSGADLGDAFLRGEFECAEQACILANNLSGWRMAENLAPGLLDNLERTIKPNLLRIDAFLRGMRSAPVSRGLVALFALAPKSAAVGLALATIDGLQTSEVQADLYHGLLSDIHARTGFGRVNVEDLRQERSASKRLTGALVHLRPPGLVQLVRHADWDKGTAEPLWTAARTILRCAWEGTGGCGPVLAMEWLVEAECQRYESLTIEQLTQDLRGLPKDMRSLRQRFSLAVRARLRDATQRPGQLGHPAIAFEALFEEALNSRAASCRDWIMRCCRDGQSHDVRRWAEQMVSEMEGLFCDAERSISDYLGYMFKAEGLMDALSKGDAKQFSEAVLGESGRLRVFRPYVVLKTDSRCSAAMGVKGLVGEGLAKACRAIELLLFPDPFSIQHVTGAPQGRQQRS